MWNGHTIRAQRNRPHVVAGIPKKNYFGRDTARKVNCAVAVDENALGKLQEALEHDRHNVDDFLPPDMMGLCQAMVATSGVVAPKTTAELLLQYRHLRACLQHHEDTQVAPLLRLATKPTGGWPALDAIVRETGRSLEDILGEAIPEDLDPGGAPDP